MRDRSPELRDVGVVHHQVIAAGSSCTSHRLVRVEEGLSCCRSTSSEQVARLHLDHLGVKLTRLHERIRRTTFGVPVDGPLLNPITIATQELGTCDIGSGSVVSAGLQSCKPAGAERRSRVFFFGQPVGGNLSHSASRHRQTGKPSRRSKLTLARRSLLNSNIAPINKRRSGVIRAAGRLSISPSDKYDLWCILSLHGACSARQRGREDQPALLHQ